MENLTLRALRRAELLGYSILAPLLRHTMANAEWICIHSMWLRRPAANGSARQRPVWPVALHRYRSQVSGFRCGLRPEGWVKTHLTLAASFVRKYPRRRLRPNCGSLRRKYLSNSEIAA